MKEDFDRLAESIKSTSTGREVIYIPNPGNFGDGLIRLGTKRFLFDYGIDHTEINVGFRGGRYMLTPFLSQRKKYFFIYGGGGARHEGIHFGYDIVRYMNMFTDKYLVLPTTVALKSSVKLKGQIYLRDKSSSRKFSESKSFCHDMAFYLITTNGSLPSFSTPTFEVGNFFRLDAEASNNQILPQNNIDLSGLGNHMSDAYLFLENISRYRIINTDRLHIAIGGVALGLDVNLFAGNYFKINDIFKASMLNFPNIKLRQWENLDPEDLNDLSK